MPRSCHKCHTHSSMPHGGHRQSPAFPCTPPDALTNVSVQAPAPMHTHAVVHARSGVDQAPALTKFVHALVNTTVEQGWCQCARLKHFDAFCVRTPPSQVLSSSKPHAQGTHTDALSQNPNKQCLQAHGSSLSSTMGGSTPADAGPPPGNRNASSTGGCILSQSSKHGRHSILASRALTTV